MFFFGITVGIFIYGTSKSECALMRYYPLVDGALRFVFVVRLKDKCIFSLH